MPTRLGPPYEWFGALCSSNACTPLHLPFFYAHDTLAQRQRGFPVHASLRRSLRALINLKYCRIRSLCGSSIKARRPERLDVRSLIREGPHSRIRRVFLNRVLLIPKIPNPPPRDEGTT